jgi:putative oxidoreductase
MLGAAMSNLGITFFPTFWGFMSALTEFGGGILILLGLFVRPAAAFMGFNMIVAMTMHLSHLDPWGRVVTPVEMLAVFLGLLFLGAGKYSLDHLISKRKHITRKEINPTTA